MARYSKLTIIGYVVRDPEQRYLPNGEMVAEFTVPYTERKRDERGEWADGETAWYRVSVFGALAQRAAEQLHKGVQVYLEGVLLPREYTDRDGRSRVSLDVRCRELRLLDKRQDAIGAEPVAAAAGAGSDTAEEQDWPF